MVKNSNPESLRKLLKFSEESSVQMDALSFLDNCCGRKQSLVVSLAISEFVEKYHLRDKSVEEIKRFIANYRVIKDTVGECRIPYPVQAGLYSPEKVLKEEYAPEEESDEEEGFKDFADSLSAAFLSA